MKAKELKDILDRLPDDAEVKVAYRLTSQQLEEPIKEVRAEMTLIPLEKILIKYMGESACIYK